MELTIDRLTKQYGNKIAVDRFTTTLRNGVYGLLGANGAGKTTLMRMLADILSPTSGDVRLNGISIYVMDEEYRDLLGYLPQNFGFYDNFSAMDFLLYMSAVKGIEKQLAISKSKELLALVGLENEAKQKIKTFSGGMRQRLGIAQALLNNPSILILDEPTAGLDPKERIRFRNLISDISSERIVILSTHIVSDIESIASQILLMKKGQLIRQGTSAETAALANGKVWEVSVSTKIAATLKDEYLIANIKHTTEHVELRIISEFCPMEGAISVPPTLEDAYLYCFREEIE